MMNEKRMMLVAGAWAVLAHVGFVPASFATQADHWTLSLDDGQTLAANATGTITDGEWTLNVLFLGDGSSAATRTVRLGRTSIMGNATGDNVYGTAFPGYDGGEGSPRSDGQPGALNLDKPIYYGDQTDWRLTEIGSRSLAVGTTDSTGNKTEWMMSLRMPQTLTGLGNEVVKHNGGNGTKLREVIFVAPSLYAGIMAYAFYGHMNITNFVLKVPHVTSLGRCFLYSPCDYGLSATDVSAWDLSCVTSIYERALARLTNARGTLRLPKLERTAKVDGNYGVFQGSGFDAIELGASAKAKITLGSYTFAACTNLQRVTIAGTVDVEVGTNVFQTCGALRNVSIGTADSPKVCLLETAFNVCTNIEEVVLGGRDQLYFEHYPFCFCKLTNNSQTAVPAKLNRLRFLGAAPTYGPAINNGTTIWGPFGSSGHIPEKQLTIEIPGNQASWTTFLANTPISTPSESETNAYHATWPSRAIPYGVLPDGFTWSTIKGTGSPLGVKFDQYIAIGDRTALPQVTCTADSRYGDQIALTYGSDGYVADADGTIPYGAPQDVVTLTASTTCENGSFVRWYYGGAISNENQRTNPLVLTFEDAARDVYGAAFQHNWVYDADKEQISDGVWALWVHPIDASAHKLAIGLPEDQRAEGWSIDKARGHALTGTGSGRLDLTGTVRDATGQAWSITSVDGYAFGTGTQTWSVRTPCITEIIFPECIETFDAQIFNRGAGSALLQTVVLEAPEMTYAAGWTFSFQGIRRMVLRIPKVTTINEMFLGSNHDASIKTVADGMQNPLDLTDVGEWDLSGVTTVYGRRTFALNCLMKGTLRLPRCTSITDKSTYAHGFLWNAQVLDGIELATEADTLSIAATAFKNSKLKNIVIGARKSLTVATDAFTGCTALTNLTYLGKAPGKDAVDAILTGVSVPDDGTKNCTIHASAAHGWLAYADPCTSKETPPSETGFMGVYVTSADERKAWLINQPNKWDPKGLLMFLR